MVAENGFDASTTNSRQPAMPKRNTVSLSPPFQITDPDSGTYEIRMSTLGRTFIKGRSDFNEAIIKNLFDKQLQEVKGKTLARFHSTRIHFTGTKYHKQLPYRNIYHFFERPYVPNVFMWYVEDDFEGRKMFESYQCNTPADVNMVRYLIFSRANAPGQSRPEIIPTAPPNSKFYIMTPIESHVTRPVRRKQTYEIHRSHSDSSGSAHSMASIENWGTHAYLATTSSPQLLQRRYSPEPSVRFYNRR